MSKGFLDLTVVGAEIQQLFEKQIAGPMEPGSIGVIAHEVYGPVMAGLFMETMILETQRNIRVASASYLTFIYSLVVSEQNMVYSKE